MDYAKFQDLLPNSSWNTIPVSVDGKAHLRMVLSVTDLTKSALGEFELEALDIDSALEFCMSSKDCLHDAVQDFTVFDIFIPVRQ